MAKQTHLAHPIYLNVPMMTSFLAAIEDGISYGVDVTRKQDKQKNAGAEGEAKVGTSHPYLVNIIQFRFTRQNNRS